MDYNKLCDEIIKLDEKIRYAGVYNTTNGKVYDKMAKERERLLSQEQTQNSLIHAYMRWKLRQQYAEFLGEPIYAMTKYTKINRITIPCGSNSLLMVSTEKDLEHQKIIDDVLNLIEKFPDDPNYTPRSPHLNF